MLTVQYKTDPTEEELDCYFCIRQSRYKEVFHLKKFNAARDVDDLRSNFVLVLFDQQVVGGVRLTLHVADSNTTLPLECDDFLLKDIFSETNLEGKTYFEASRLAISYPDENRQVIIGLFKNMLLLAKHLGCEYLFAVSPKAQARYYRQIFHSFEANFEIQKTKVPDKAIYEGHAMSLSLLDLKNVYSDMLHTEPFEIEPIDVEKYTKTHRCSCVNELPAQLNEKVLSLSEMKAMLSK